jgi:beta-fructofuranosidase
MSHDDALPTRRHFLATMAAMSTVPHVAAAQADGSSPDVAKAMEALRAAIPIASKDPERPIYHFRPPAQLNPTAPQGGNQHWGHARSRDLVNWEHLPIALWPSRDKGERAIFSGGAVIAKDGRPRLIYTSIGHPQPEQWMALPEDDDLIRWRKFSGNPVVSQAAHGGLIVDQWRDPFMFQEGGRTYMVCGGNSKTTSGGAGQVYLYLATKDDLSAWQHLGPVFQALERDTYNIECPNLFKLGDKWVLLTSPHRACEYYVGSLDIRARRFVPDTHGILDAGDAYASNISYDDRGRTLLWLWGRTNTPQGRGWNGVMVLPRVLSLGPDGGLRQAVPAEFASLRGPVRTFSDLSLSDGARVLDGLPADALEIEAEFATGGAGTFGFELRRSAADAPAVVVAIQRGMVTVGNVRAYVGNAERYRLRLFLDRRCLEVYVNDGAAAVYTILDAVPLERVLAVFARAGGGAFGAPGNRPANVRLESLRAWPMAPASHSLDRFLVP